MKQTIMLVVLFAVAAMAQSPSRGTRSDSQLDAAVVRGDWSEVAKITNALQVPDPVVAKFIKAHASLALNKGDDALCLFAALNRHVDIQRWAVWARQFVS